MKNVLLLKDSPLRNLSTVIRYSGFRLLQPESVDTHTMDMNILALLIIDYFEEAYPEKEFIDRKDLIYRIVIHDLEESCSCDIPRSLKYYNEEVLQAIEQATQGLIAPHVSDRLLRDMNNAKNLSTLEGRIVKFLDIFQCNLILYKEVVEYGNSPLKGLLETAAEYLNTTVLIDKLFNDDQEEIKFYFIDLVEDWNQFIGFNPIIHSFNSIQS